MNDKDKGLYHKASGCTEFGVRECDSLKQLLEWEITIRQELIKIHKDLNAAKLKRRETGIMAEPEWWMKVNGSKMALNTLISVIEVRQAELQLASIERSEKTGLVKVIGTGSDLDGGGEHPSRMFHKRPWQENTGAYKQKNNPKPDNLTNS